MWLVGPGDGYPSGARAVDFPQDMSSRGEWAKEDRIKYIKSVVYSDRSMRRWKEGAALHAASVNGHFEVASLLVKNGADPNSRDDLGRAPLHRLSHGGPLVMAQSSFEVARLLVNSGADASVTDDEGRTPLHLAARRGYRDVVELSLESGASLDVRAMDTVTHGLCEWEA